MRQDRSGGIAIACGLTLTLALAACGGGGQGGEGAGAPNGDILANALLPAGPPATPPTPPTEPPVAPVTAWLGRWNGPEGTFLDIARHPGGLPRVQLTLKDDLDNAGDLYVGRAEGRTIRFIRDGEALTIRPGSGAETGFKWLADKKDCLILIAGREGYCRD